MWEAEIERIAVQSQPGKKFETPVFTKQVW
jgi:hypothetical protein